jgi:hypothetical protein
MLTQSSSPARTALLTAALAMLVLLGAVLLIMELLAKYESQQCTLANAGPVGGVPAQLAPIYRSAAAEYSLGPLGPAVLAAINYVESDFGQNLSTSSAGAVGWMQFEPGTWQTYGVTPTGAKAPDGPAGWNDPQDAIYSAANYLHAAGAPGDWQQAVYTYNHAGWYVSEVLGRANGYYRQGLKQTGSSQPVFVSAPSAGSCGAAPGGYANPLASATSVTPQRIDMGVDYDGAGPIDAIGDAQIKFAGTGIGGGWVCDEPTNGGVVYQLENGPDAGRYVYVTEDVIPAATVGETVRAGQPVAAFATGDGRSCIETGWATGPSPAPQAAADGQASSGGDPGQNRTYCGQQMSDLIQSLGGPAGLTEGKPLVGSSC